MGFWEFLEFLRYLLSIQKSIMFTHTHFQVLKIQILTQTLQFINRKLTLSPIKSVLEQNKELILAQIWTGVHIWNVMWGTVIIGTVDYTRSGEGIAWAERVSLTCKVLYGRHRPRPLPVKNGMILAMSARETVKTRMESPSEIMMLFGTRWDLCLKRICRNA